MSHYTSKVRTDIDLVDFIVGDMAEVHAKGCGHQRRAQTEPRDFRPEENTIYEDWYKVAPCAKAGQGFVCDRGGCVVCA